MKSRAWILLFALPLIVRAQTLDELPAYQPEGKVSGVIRTWGHVFVKDAMKNWEEGFKKFHPDARFERESAAVPTTDGLRWAAAFPLDGRSQPANVIVTTT